MLFLRCLLAGVKGCQTFCSRFGFKWFKNQEAIKPMTINPMKKKSGFLMVML